MRSSVAFFRPRLRAAGSSERARGARAYLKSDLRFYGATVPDVRRVAREYVRAHPDLDRRALRAAAEELYGSDVHELRSAAIAVLAARRASLEERDLPWLIDLVDASDTWAHVDWLAVSVIGDVIGRHPSALRWLRVWANQRSLWIRRTAVLAQLDPLKRGAGDWTLFTRIAASLLREKEFFIRKAIGWVLRETSKQRPAIVFEFLRAHRGDVSGLTLREGAKFLSDEQRRSLGLAPWRGRDGRAYSR